MKAVITMGIPAAGKSTVVNERYDLQEWVLIDPDEIKKEHPDYDPLKPEGVHEWSKAIAKARLFEAVAERKQLIIDGTGTNVEKMVDWIHQLHGVGYEVKVLFVKCQLQTALKRNALRERVVPEEIVREKASLIGIAFEIISGYADKVEVVVTD